MLITLLYGMIIINIVFMVDDHQSCVQVDDHQYSVVFMVDDHQYSVHGDDHQ